MMPNEPSVGKLGKKVGNKLDEQFEHLKSGLDDLAKKTGMRDSSDRRSTARKTARATSRTASRTKEQLYAEAKRLGVKGRSKMTKDELAKAVRHR